MLHTPQYKLSVSREGFIYRGAFLHNMLDEQSRTETDISKFKIRVKDWVKDNITMKPKSYFLKIIGHQYRNRSIATDLSATTRQSPNQPQQNTITRYFAPV